MANSKRKEYTFAYSESRAGLSQLFNFCLSHLSTRSFANYIPYQLLQTWSWSRQTISADSKTLSEAARPLSFACLLIAVFSFLVSFLKLVHRHFHGPGLFIHVPKRITPLKMLGS